MNKSKKLKIKLLYYKNAHLILMAVLILSVLVISGCGTGSASAPPSGPIGGGCG